MLDGSMYAVVAARSYVMDKRLSCHTMDHLTRSVSVLEVVVTQ